MIINIFLYTLFLCTSDSILEYFNINGRYYFNHSIINLMILYTSFNNLISCYTNFNNTINIKTNPNNIYYIFAIHLYHILYYYYKFRFDDWLHHILMVCITLPLALNIKTGAILEHTLFFIIGLPGFIDYLLLFLVRNALITKYTEKYINYMLNLWIRCPGCIASSTLILVYYGHNYIYLSLLDRLSILTIMFTIYWNGIYFMRDILVDYIIKYKKN